MKMDPIELFSKNAEMTVRPETYRRQLAKAAELVVKDILGAAGLDNIGCVRTAQGRYDETIQSFEGAIAIPFDPLGSRSAENSRFLTPFAT